MGKSALVHQSGEEVRAQGSEEHTQPRDTVQVKCNQCWSGFLGSLVCLSSWSDGFDKRLSHDFRFAARRVLYKSSYHWLWCPSLT